jgi:hypothetical protein
VASYVTANLTLRVEPFDLLRVLRLKRLLTLLRVGRSPVWSDSMLSGSAVSASEEISGEPRFTSSAGAALDCSMAKNLGCRN